MYLRVLFLLSLAICGWSQESGGFRGRIVDQANTAIPGVTVTIEEQSTKRRAAFSTGANGEFEARGLTRGVFSLTAEAKGFKTSVQTGLILYAGQVRRVDIQLQIGDVVESVEVKESASVIELDSPAIAYKQANREIYGLNRQTAGWLVYTVENHPGQEVRSQVHGSYANGLQSAQDGVSLMGYSQQGRLPQEVVQDITQVSLNAAPEFQHATTVIGTGRQGSNRPRGEIFFEYRHQALNALPVGQTVRPPARPTTAWSYDGAGPVWIPRVYDGRNKTFFRFLYQPARIRQIETLDGFDAPTQPLRQGDLNAVSALLRRPILDPANGQPFPDNTIPANRISRVARNAMELIPLPNFGPPGSLADNFRFFNEYNEPRAWQHYRVDHRLTANNNLSVTVLRFFRDTTHTADDSPQNTPIDRTATTRAYSIKDTHLVNPRTVNEFTFFYNRQAQDSKNGTMKGADYLQRLGISTAGRTLPDALGGPLLNLTTFRSNRNTSIVGGRGNQETVNTDASVVGFRDNVSINFKGHLFKTGADLNYQRPFLETVAPGSFGILNYTGNFTNSDWGDFLLGLPFTSSISQPRPALDSRHLELGFFAQDEWKVNPRLTVTAGARFQHYGVPFDRNGLYYNFDLAGRRVVVPDSAALAKASRAYPRDIPIVTASEAGFPEKLARFPKLLAEPRIGLAWRPTGTGFVVRAGYGIFHVPYSRPTAASAGEILPGRNGGPFSLTESFGPNRIAAGAPQFTSENPFPAGPGAVGLQSVTALPVDLRRDRWPYDQQWNFTIEKSLAAAIGVRASYVGSKGTNWPYVRDLQTPFVSTERFNANRRPFGPAPYVSVLANELGGNSTYHALELELHRQFSSGLYFRAWYDFRRSLNDVDGGLFGSSEGTQPEYPHDRSRDKGWQDGGVPHSARFVAIYDLPFGRGKRIAPYASSVLQHVIGGWSVAPFMTIRSQQRYTAVFTGADPANTGRSTGRADALCDANGFGTAPGQMWNPACFALPANGALGSASRGALAGPTAWRTSFNVFKTWKLLPREQSPYLRFEMYVDNPFNHSNADTLVTNNIRATGFGQFRVSSLDTRVVYFRLRLGI